VASLSQGRTAAAQCGLFTHKSVPVIFEPPCTSHYLGHGCPCSFPAVSTPLASAHSCHSVPFIEHRNVYFCLRKISDLPYILESNPH